MLVCLFTQMETNDKKLILKDSIFIMNLFGTLKKKIKPTFLHIYLACKMMIVSNFGVADRSHVFLMQYNLIMFVILQIIINTYFILHRYGKH